MAIDPVVVRFAVGGVAEVDRAFDSIVRRIERTEQESTRAFERGSKSRIRGAQDEETSRTKAAQKLAREEERLERLKQREAERASHAKEMIVRRSSEAAGRFAEQQAKEEIRAAEKAAREVERLEQYKLRVRIRSAELAGREAARAAEMEAASSRRVSGSFGSAAGRGIRAGAGMAGMAMGALSIGGGFALADIVGKQLSAEKTAALLVNAGTTGNVAPGTVQDALRAATAATSATGMGRDEILRGSLRYAQSARGGDFGGALANMGFFAKMAKATNADIGDIGEAAGVLQSQNAELAKDPKKMQQMLLNVLAQSHAGSMSLVDAAKQIGTMGSVRSAFSGDETTVQRSLFGIGQIARVGGDVGEAGTFVKDLALEVAIANRKWHERTGGRTIHGKMVGGQDLVSTNQFGQIDSPEALVAQVFRGTKGDMGMINDLFGKRGSVLFRELQKSYITGAGPGGKNVEGGVQAALANLNQVSGATMTPDQLDKQVQTMLATPGERVHAAWEKLTATTGDKLEPALLKFATFIENKTDTIAKFGDTIEQVAEIFLEHPWASIGGIVGGRIALEIGKAGIASLFREAIIGGIAQSQAAGGSAAAGAIKGGAGAGGKLLGGGAVAALGIASVIGQYDIGQGLGEGTAGGKATAASILGDIKGGKASAGDVAAKLAAAQKTVSETSGAGSVAKGVLGSLGIDPLAQSLGIVGAGKSVLGGEDAASIAKKQAAALEITKNADNFKKALDDMAGRLRSIAAADPARAVPIDHRTGGGS